MNVKGKWYTNVSILILIGFILGIAAGFVFNEKAIMFKPVGEVFIVLIKMLVVPLIIFSVVLGASSLGKNANAGRVGAITFSFFFLTSFLAVFLAIALGYIFEPGEVVLSSDILSGFSNEYQDKGQVAGFWATILGIIPSNVFASMSDANILQILTFCVFFGIGLSKISEEKSQYIIKATDSVLQVLIWMINVIMYTAPIGVFALTASSIGTYGFATLSSVLNLFLVYIFAIAIFGFIIYPLLVTFFSKKGFLEFISKMKKAQIVAFSTSSSMATLPVSLKTSEEDFNVSNSTASFIIPLGATINMTGNAIYYGLVAMFFAQFYSIELTMATYFTIAITSTLGAIGQAGIPGPSFLVVTVLIAAGIPIEGLPLLFALDRIFDMIRTSLNITGDVACSIIVDEHSK